jgi:hypothetical protein
MGNKLNFSLHVSLDLVGEPKKLMNGRLTVSECLEYVEQAVILGLRKAKIREVNLIIVGEVILQDRCDRFGL